MPALSNHKHELFAQELAKGNTADEAYVLAGYPRNRGNAATLKAKQSISDRVAEIVSRGAIRAEVTLASLLTEAEEVRAAAFAAKQFAPAIAAIKEKGVLSGLRVEKRENFNRNADEMTDAELERIASGRSADAVAAESGPALFN